MHAKIRLNVHCSGAIPISYVLSDVVAAHSYGVDKGSVLFEQTLKINRDQQSTMFQPQRSSSVATLLVL